MKPYLTPDDRPQAAAWIPPFVALVAVAAFLLVLRAAGVVERFRWSSPPPVIGQVTRAFGTVNRTGLEAAHRLPTGRELHEALRIGDQIQTGENSAAELSFRGGATLRLQPGSLLRFEDRDEEIALRMVLGQGFLELPSADSESGRPFVFHRADGALAEIPEGDRFLVGLNDLEGFDEAVDVSSIEAKPRSEGEAKDLELRYLAHGEEVGGRYEQLVRPIAEPDHELSPLLADGKRSLARPDPVYPVQEDEVDVEKQDGVSFKWEAPAEETVSGRTPAAVAAAAAKEIVGYEVTVRPAFGYQVEDDARKHQVFRLKGKSFRELKIAHVGGGGVFLWSVRAITRSGRIGPATEPRWLEIRFPKRLLAPELRGVRVER